MTEPTLSSVHISHVRDDVVCVTLDLPGSGANVLSQAFLDELEKAQTQIREIEGLAGLILISAKPKIFVAGANLKEINRHLDWPEESIIRFANRGREIYDAFGRFPFPTIAAVHGACVGGGLELALGCHRRVATNDRRSIFGLPETNLGLIPGWAGTVRVPRRVGLEKGLKLIVSGKVFPATEAMEMGLVDRVVDTQEQLIDASLELIDSDNESQDHLAARQKTLRPITLSAEEISSIADRCTTKGLAQQVVKRHILESCALSFEDACHSEAKAFAETWGSDQSYGLLNQYFLGEHNKKSPGCVDVTLPVRPIKTVTVIGAGLMGHGIATACLKSGLDVWILDSNAELANSVAQSLQSVGPEIRVVQQLSDIAPSELIIESIVESLESKQQLLSEVESVCSDDAIIASNTSSIPINEIASAMTSRERVCGIHFCHPEMMKLVEVVRGVATSEATLASAVQFVRSLRKMPVVVQDGPGFVVNRVLSAMLDQAILLLTWGHSIEEIDAAIRDAGFGAGPFEMMDIIGVDTCLHAGSIMSQRGIQCVNGSPIIPRMVKRNRLGRKTDAGFYRYSQSETAPIIDPAVTELLKDYTNEPKPARDSDVDFPIASQVFAAMTLEATRILKDQLVNDPRDIDLCVIHGLSFPAELGGLLFHAGKHRARNCVDILEWLTKIDSRFTPTEKLNAIAATSGTFY